MDAWVLSHVIDQVEVHEEVDEEEERDTHLDDEEDVDLDLEEGHLERGGDGYVHEQQGGDEVFPHDDLMEAGREGGG